jgi:TonB family protein
VIRTELDREAEGPCSAYPGSGTDRPERAAAIKRRGLPTPLALSVVAHGLLAFMFGAVPRARPASSIVTIEIQEPRPPAPVPERAEIAPPQPPIATKRPIAPAPPPAAAPTPEVASPTPAMTAETSAGDGPEVAAAPTPAIAAPAAGPARPAGPPAAEKSAGTRFDMGAYLAALQARVGRHKRYPEMALRMGLEGTTEVAVALNPDGTLACSPTIAASSGHELLDSEALRIVASAAPYPPLTGHDGRVNVRVPVRFHLDD